MIKILPCSCKHDAQDQMYGKGQRVHNPCGAKNKGQVRCTVCGTKK
jgi:hypothetical protein